MRNQLDKIIITAMDRFVWFVLLVVISHLVTELTRVTGYARGPRQDAVTVNDSSTPLIKVQNLVLYPGQEYGLLEQQSQLSYNGNNIHLNPANNRPQISNTKSNNFLSSLFNQLTNNSPSGQQQQQQPQSSRIGSGSSTSSTSNNLNFPSDKDGMKPFSLRPIIDSIFEIPMSTLRAVGDLMRSLIGGFLQPPEPHQSQQQPAKYASVGAQPSSCATPKAVQPKSEFEMLNGARLTTGAATAEEQHDTHVASA